MVKDSTAHCNAIFFPPIVIASGYIGYVDYHPFYLGVLGLHVVAFLFVWFVGSGYLECSCWGGSSVVYWSAINYNRRKENRITVSSKILKLNNLYT
jgi:hypothetical protein